MAKALFVSVKFLKENTYIDENVDEKNLNFTIVTVQDLKIHPIVGTGLFNELKTEVSAGSVSALNQTLLNDFIQPAVLWWIIEQFPRWFTQRLTNKALMKKTSDNSVVADEDSIITVAQDARNKAEWYSTRITEFLLENDEDYPLYLDPGDGVDIIHPKRRNYDVGIVFGVKPRERRSFEDRLQGNIDSDCLDC